MLRLSRYLESKDYHRILGVTRKSTKSQIKAAFITKSKQCHPDRFPGDKSKETQFKDVNEAYQTLKNGQSSAYSAPKSSSPSYPSQNYSGQSNHSKSSGYSAYEHYEQKNRAYKSEERRRRREAEEAQDEAIRKATEAIKSTWTEHEIGARAKTVAKTGVNWYFKAVGGLWAVAAGVLIYAKVN